MKKVFQWSLTLCLFVSLTFDVNAASRDLNLDDFTGISLSSHYNVILKQGNKQKVRAEGPEAVINNLNTTVKDDVWGIYDKRKSNNSWSEGAQGKVTIYITIPKLKYLSIAGSGNVTCDQFNVEEVTLKVTGSGDLKMGIKASNSISATLSGSGNIKISGSANTLTAKVTGSGNIKGVDMTVNTANATVTGSGNISIHCTEAMTAKVTGSGNIKYKGSQKVESKTTGSGKIKRWSK